MSRLQDLRDKYPDQAEGLDPSPYRSRINNFRMNHDLGGIRDDGFIRMVFDPRPQYEQDPGFYNPQPLPESVRGRNVVAQRPNQNNGRYGGVTYAQWA